VFEMIFAGKKTLILFLMSSTKGQHAGIQ